MLHPILKKITSWGASTQNSRLNPKAKILEANAHMHICTDFANRYTEEQKYHGKRKRTGGAGV